MIKYPETAKTDDSTNDLGGEGSQIKNKFFIEDTSRVDAGGFHMGFALGGNFYVEPQYSLSSLPIGGYFNDFGFQGGVFFDYDYSELQENIPLALRGMIAYKYILNSVNVFAFDGTVRHMIRLSQKGQFGIGGGVSAGVWYRTVNAISSSEFQQTAFVPALIVETGFDFDPFMVDLKWMIKRFGNNNTTTGLELYFGVRL